MQHPLGSHLCGFCYFSPFSPTLLSPSFCLFTHPELLLTDSAFPGKLDIQTCSDTHMLIADRKSVARSEPCRLTPLCLFSTFCSVRGRGWCTVCPPALLCTRAACCSISSLSTEHLSSSLQSGLAVGCSRALSKAHSGTAICAPKHMIL